MTPLTHPAKKIGPDGQREQGRGAVTHVQEEVYHLTLTFRRRVARYLPFTHPAQKIDQVDSAVRTRTWGSPT